MLSKTVYDSVKQSLPHANTFVLKAEFNRMFYSPALRRQLTKAGKSLSNRNVLLHNIRKEIENRPKQLAQRTSLIKIGKVRPASQGAPEKKDLLDRYLDK